MSDAENVGSAPCRAVGRDERGQSNGSEDGRYGMELLHLPSELCDSLVLSTVDTYAFVVSDACGN